MRITIFESELHYTEKIHVDTIIIIAQQRLGKEHVEVKRITELS